MGRDIHSPSRVIHYLKMRLPRLEAYYRENNIDPELATGDIIRLYALVTHEDNVMVYQDGVDGSFHRENFRALARYLFGHVRKAIDRLIHLVIGSAIFITDIQDGELQSFRLPKNGKKNDNKLDKRQRLIDWDAIPP